MTEQLFLFEDRLTLLNRGILDLTRLNLEEAAAAFERYKALYRDENRVEAELQVTDFLKRGFAEAPEPCSEVPAYLCGLWNSFERWRRSQGFSQEDIVSEIKSSFFRKIIGVIAECNMADTAFLSERIPTGYVYLQAGQYDAAIKALQGCIPVRPHDARIYGYLGDAYLLRGDPAVARQCYLEACLIEVPGIDWDHAKDAALLQLKDDVLEQYGRDRSLSLEWLPSHACIQGLFPSKKLKLNQGIKEFVDEYLEMRKRFLKNPSSALKAKLFLRGIILCDNEPLLRFVKGVDFIDVRRQMKETNPALFSKYLKRVASGNPYPR
jgi:tetratricopeptide (TPR) repeat protein